VLDQLVILTGKEPEQATWIRFQEHYQVTQRVSRRVFLVQAVAPNPNVPEWEGVHLFSTPDIPDEILHSLDEKESLFVSAWRERMRQPLKTRLGEGLNWDYPGFKPPR
jgi:hypothetical protein